MAVAPHALAAQSALGVLREGGNAVEAMISAAAAIAVVYPHMNSIGGDGFWLIGKPGEAPRGIEGCGAAAAGATIEHYRDAGYEKIPFRGGMAACTVAGTISGWDAAFQYSREALGGTLPLSRLLADAIDYARAGAPVSPSQARCVTAKRAELEPIAAFAESFLQPGQMLAGERQRQPKLAATLEQLVRAGLDDFYRGELAASMAGDLARAGSPLSLSDLNHHRSVRKPPLHLQHTLGTIWNMPPPTQGLIALLILGQLDRLLEPGMDPLGADYVHACVEATKQAFLIRDSVVTDPAFMKIDPQHLLQAASLDAMAGDIDAQRARPWGQGRGPADTVWMGAIDADGVAVSFIQSLYHEFGSGIVLQQSGVNWQNRGSSFSLDPQALNPLMPGRKPFHTLIPAMARLDDGRSIVYGNMGGDGQPQSQAAVFSRIAVLGMDPQAAISAPRWLLGRTWGQTSDSLKLESRFPQSTVDALRSRGHDIELLQPYDETAGHAGAVIRHPNGLFEGGFDPRSDGCVACW